MNSKLKKGVVFSYMLNLLYTLIQWQPGLVTTDKPKNIYIIYSHKIMHMHYAWSRLICQ